MISLVVRRWEYERLMRSWQAYARPKHPGLSPCAGCGEFAYGCWCSPAPILAVTAGMKTPSPAQPPLMANPGPLKTRLSPVILGTPASPVTSAVPHDLATVKVVATPKIQDFTLQVIGLAVVLAPAAQPDPVRKSSAEIWCSCTICKRLLCHSCEAQHGCVSLGGDQRPGLRGGMEAPESHGDASREPFGPCLFCVDGGESKSAPPSQNQNPAPERIDADGRQPPIGDSNLPGQTQDKPDHLPEAPASEGTTPQPREVRGEARAGPLSDEKEKKKLPAGPLSDEKRQQKPDHLPEASPSRERNFSE